MIYVYCIFVVFVIGFLKCFKVDEYKDMLITVSEVSGPLGFIVGCAKASKEWVHILLYTLKTLRAIQKLSKRLKKYPNWAKLFVAPG